MIWRAEELADLNRAYAADVHAPGLLLFGSNGGGESYGFDMHNPNKPIVQVPFVGMNLRYATQIAVSFTDLLISLGKKALPTTEPNHKQPHPIGMELFEIKPIILGGDPKNPQNKIWLTRQQHTEAVCYWNHIIQSI